MKCQPAAETAAATRDHRAERFWKRHRSREAPIRTVVKVLARAGVDEGRFVLHG
jgi:hypothetical protein